MQNNSQKLSKMLGIVVTIVLLASLFQWRASQNLASQNYYKSNFFVFWLSGKLILEGQSPYNPSHWANGHMIYGQVTPREPTFLYPLPLAVFLTPLGLLSTGQAYYLWQWFSQIAIALVVLILLHRWKSTTYERLFIPIIIFLTFFGPAYLTLQIGSLGPLTLLFIFGALYCLDKNYFIPAGILLSLTMLKPSQGATLLLLLGWVFLIRRQWRIFWGIAIGGALLLLIGFFADPNWLNVFRQSSAAAFDRRLGVQSTVWSFSYLVCNGKTPCDTILGGIGTVLLLGGCAYFIWVKHIHMTYWQIFNIVIPVAFVSSLYMWAYDQILYIFPIIWIGGTLVEKSKSYFFTFLFFILLDLISLFALVQQAFTEKDLWSLGTTLVVLLFLFVAWRMKPKPTIDKAPASA
ncbi:MAG: glycosyltransferase family 87 protein [Anaerolineales bacterium]